MPTYKTNNEANQIELKYTYLYENIEETISFIIEVAKTKNNHICLTFRHKQGNYLYYKDLVENIKGEFLDCEVTQ